MTTAIISNFNALESAALYRIANDYPEHTACLIKIFSRCTVIKRLNTGKGFYSDISIDGPVQLPNGFFDNFRGRLAKCRRHEGWHLLSYTFHNKDPTNV